MIEVALGEFNIPKWSFHKCSGVYFLSKEVSYIRAFIENNKNAEWAVKYHIDKGPLQELKSRKTVPDISYIKQTSESMYLKK